MSAHPVLFNPRLPAAELAEIAGRIAPALQSLVPATDPHVFVMTSGSSSSAGLGTWVALSRRALAASAEAVVAHLGLVAEDVWLLALPEFHVGGIGVIERARFAGSRVVRDEGAWDPARFVATVEREGVTLASLVPTQVHDLVGRGLRAPARLRRVVIGGGRLAPALLAQAQALAWPLLPSYGLTECSSQVATALPESPSELRLLPHVEARVDAERYLWIRSPALFSGYAREVDGQWELQDPKVDGWYRTADLAALSGRTLEIEGRVEGFLKIGGESTHLPRLEEALQRALDEVYGPGAPEARRLVLCPVSDARLGTRLLLAAETGLAGTDRVMARFNQAVLPFEAIRERWFVTEIPRSALGKPLLARLAQSIVTEGTI